MPRNHCLFCPLNSTIPLAFYNKSNEIDTQTNNTVSDTFLNGSASTLSHQRLHHADSLSSQQVDALEDVDGAVGRGLLRQDVDGDEGPRPTDTGTTEKHKTK